jgi:hypothetical protein
MDERELDSIRGWFTGRLPDGWFTSTEVLIEDDQIVVLGTLPDVNLPEGASQEEREGAAAGRISRFREQTRGERVGIAQEAEERFRKFVTWGARLAGVTKRFTPGGSGRGQRRGVMIGRRWGRHGHGHHSPSGSTPQVF